MGLYLEGRFNGVFFALLSHSLLALPVWGGLYLEGLIFGIGRYYTKKCPLKNRSRRDLT